MFILFEFTSVLFWGILSSLVLVGCVVCLFKNIFSIPSWSIVLISVFLFFFCSFQFSTLYFAVKAKGYIADMEELTNTTRGIADNWNEIESSYPVLKPFLEDVKENLGTTSVLQKSAVLTSITDVINGYLWRRVGWIAGIVVIVFTLVFLLDSMRITTQRRSNRRPIREYSRDNQTYNRRRSRVRR